MKLVPLSEIFNIEYGNKLNLNAMTIDAKGVNFVSRSSKNLGVVETVKKIPGIEPYESGMITVTLGGTYLLSSFIQPKAFYTAQNIKVLSPKTDMSFSLKAYYCLCISNNRFKYTSHGREANKSLDEIMVPSLSSVPDWINAHNTELINSSAFHDSESDILNYPLQYFKLERLFSIERGRGARKTDVVDNGKTPFITSVDKNNGVSGFVNNPPSHDGNVLSVNRNGSVAEAFYQPKPFCSTEDVHIFTPKFSMTIYHAMYLIPLLRAEKFRYTYGRKWGIDRMNNTMIRLPVDAGGEPAWSEIESYIKTLPYSKSLINDKNESLSVS